MMDFGYWTSSRLTKSERKFFPCIYRLVGVDWISKKAKYMCKQDTNINLDLELVRKLDAIEGTDKNATFLGLYEDKKGKNGYISVLKGGMFLNTSGLLSQPFLFTDENASKIKELAMSFNAELVIIEDVSDKLSGSIRLSKISLINGKLVMLSGVLLLALAALSVVRSLI